MNYIKFYLAIRRYRKKRITRWEFLRDWRDAQNQQHREETKETSI